MANYQLEFLIVLSILISVIFSFVKEVTKKARIAEEADWANKDKQQLEDMNAYFYIVDEARRKYCEWYNNPFVIASFGGKEVVMDKVLEDWKDVDYKIFHKCAKYDSSSQVKQLALQRYYDMKDMYKSTDHYKRRKWEFLDNHLKEK